MNDFLNKCSPCVLLLVSQTPPIYCTVCPLTSFYQSWLSLIKPVSTHVPKHCESDFPWGSDFLKKPAERWTITTVTTAAQLLLLWSLLHEEASSKQITRQLFSLATVGTAFTKWLGEMKFPIFPYSHEQTQVVGYQLCAIPRYLGASSSTFIINEKTFVPTLQMAGIEILVLRLGTTTLVFSLFP